MKMPAVTMIFLGILLCCFGIYLTFQQGVFDTRAESAVATVLSVSGGGRRGNGAPIIFVEYSFEGTSYKTRIHQPLFGNSLGIDMGDLIDIRVDSASPEDAQIVSGIWDTYLYYMAGVFFTLLGLMFGMFGIIIQKNPRVS